MGNDGANPFASLGEFSRRDCSCRDRLVPRKGYTKALNRQVTGTCLFISNQFEFVGELGFDIIASISNFVPVGWTEDFKLLVAQI